MNVSFFQLNRDIQYTKLAENYHHFINIDKFGNIKVEKSSRREKANDFTLWNSNNGWRADHEWHLYKKHNKKFHAWLESTRYRDIPHTYIEFINNMKRASDYNEKQLIEFKIGMIKSVEIATWQIARNEQLKEWELLEPHFDMNKELIKHVHDYKEANEWNLTKNKYKSNHR